MNDSVWYYARGDVEKGPITTVQIKALVGAGKLRRDDFVWKEGMDSWSPAGEVSDLYPAGIRHDKSDGKDKAAEGASDSRKFSATTIQTRPERESESSEFVRLVGRVLFVLGLLVALSSRGCDAISGRNVTRLGTVASSARQRFDEQHEKQRLEIQAESDFLRRKETRTNTENERMRQLGEAATKLANETQQKRQGLARGLWHENDLAAADAAEQHLQWGYWRQVAFLLSSLALTLGLLAMGFSSDGAERWIGFVMLAVIVYSLFAGGSVWDK